MTKRISLKELRNRFRLKYYEEFDDPNESFMNYMLDLIPKEVLKDLLFRKRKDFYSYFEKYK